MKKYDPSQILRAHVPLSLAHPDHACAARADHRRDAPPADWRSAPGSAHFHRAANQWPAHGADRRRSGADDQHARRRIRASPGDLNFGFDRYRTSFKKHLKNELRNL